MYIPEYKKGGMVRKTGMALVHKGELIIPSKKVAMVKKAIRMYKRRKAIKRSTYHKIRPTTIKFFS